MGGTRAAVAAAIVSSEIDGTGKAGTLAKIAGGGFAIEATPYADFVEAYFSDVT